jgi:hypothetical protein
VWTAVASSQNAKQSKSLVLGQGLNPIEPAWAKVKGILRKAAARTVGGLHAALGPTLAAISKDDARAFFRHAGYVCPN